MVSALVWLPVQVVQLFVVVVLKAANVYLHKHCFPAHYRLKTKADFHLMRQGRHLNVDGLHIVYRKNALQHARLGLAVSRKFGNAVKRNRLKRVLREVFRQYDMRDIAVDVLMMPVKKKVINIDYALSADQALAMIVHHMVKSSL